MPTLSIHAFNLICCSRLDLEHHDTTQRKLHASLGNLSCRKGKYTRSKASLCTSSSFSWKWKCRIIDFYFAMNLNLAASAFAPCTRQQDLPSTHNHTVKYNEDSPLSIIIHTMQAESISRDVHSHFCPVTPTWPALLYMKTPSEMLASIHTFSSIRCVPHLPAPKPKFFLTSLPFLHSPGRLEGFKVLRVMALASSSSVNSRPFVIVFCVSRP